MTLWALLIPLLRLVAPAQDACQEQLELCSVPGSSDEEEFRMLISLGHSVTGVGVSLTQIVHSVGEGGVMIPLGKSGCF